VGFVGACWFSLADRETRLTACEPLHVPKGVSKLQYKGVYYYKCYLHLNPVLHVHMRDLAAGSFLLAMIQAAAAAASA
jgi:hypothetical protein